MPKLIMLVGPPGSGKSTYAENYKLKNMLNGEVVRISQDDQGKTAHLDIFNDAISRGKDIIVDRMNFDKNQRNRYLDPSKRAGYETHIIVFHVPLKTCLERCNARKNHPTIQDEKSASQAVNLFFTKYERVEDSEANFVERLGWVGLDAVKCIWSDLDGTLADVEHRRHHVRPSVPIWAGEYDAVPLDEPIKPKFKPNWKAFFDEMSLDPVDPACEQILREFSAYYPIVYATGRPDNYKEKTEAWLDENGLRFPGSSLFMRARNDMRKDDIVKEIILEFEVKTRYNVFFALDDRDQVVKMLRKHGIKVMQVAEGDF